MRNLFIIGMLLVAAFTAGWFTIDRDGEQTTIKINRDEIRSDAKQAIDRGRGYLDRQNQESQLRGEYPASATAGYNDPNQDSTQLRYQQQGGQYGVPSGYQPPPYPLNPPTQSAGNPNSLPPLPRY